MEFHEQHQLRFKVPTTTRTMEADEQSQPQLQNHSCSTTQIAYSTTTTRTPDQGNHGALLPAFYNVSVNRDQKNPSSSRSVNRNYDFNSFPPGIRFKPTDSELITYYLMPKVEKREIPSVHIRDVNLYQHSPDKIAEMYQELKEREGYFFTPRDRKYPNGDRPNRATGGGYWKATGSDRPIVNDGRTIGFKKTLVYYQGEAKKGGVKTNWIMHEYCLPQKKKEKRSEIVMRLDDFVLCRIYEKRKKTFQNRQPVEAQGLKAEVDDGHGEGSPQDQENMEGFHEIDHPSGGFDNAFWNDFQSSETGFLNVEDEVALAGFDDVLIPVDDRFSMLNMDYAIDPSSMLIVPDNPNSPPEGYFI